MPVMNERNLERAWNIKQVSTREDLEGWMRRFSVELLRENPSPALRACSSLAQVIWDHFILCFCDAVILLFCNFVILYVW